jgi:hypothetical protein
LGCELQNPARGSEKPRVAGNAIQKARVAVIGESISERRNLGGVESEFTSQAAFDGGFEGASDKRLSIRFRLESELVA